MFLFLGEFFLLSNWLLLLFRETLFISVGLSETREERGEVNGGDSRGDSDSDTE